MSIYKYDSTQDKLIPLAGGVLYADVPVGTIMPYGGSNPVDGFLLCQGQAVSRTTYAELFKVVGTAFGAGDGSTTFNVPDLRGEFLRGAGANSHANQGDGGSVGEHQDGTILDGNGTLDNQMRINKHNSSLFDKVHSINTPVAYVTGSAAQSSNGVYGTVRPTNTSVNYIIKAKQVAVPADFKDAIDDILEVSEPVSATNTEYIIKGNIIWKRSGNVVEVTFFNVAFSSQISGGVTLATGLPPSKNYSWSVINSLANANVQQGVAVNTDGSLTSIGGSTGGSGYYDSFTYLAAN